MASRVVTAGFRVTPRTSQLSSFRSRCEAWAGHPLPTPADLHAFSVAQRDTFWRLLLEWSGIRWSGRPEPVCTSDVIEEATFFPGLSLNYAENLLCTLPGVDDSAPALTSLHADRPAERFSRAELRDVVGRTATALTALGLSAGDRAVAIVSNNATAAITALGAASIGVTLATATPDMGRTALAGRFGQVHPVVLLVDRAVPPGTPAVTDAVLQDVVAQLPTCRTVVVLDELPHPQVPDRDVCRLSELVARTATATPARWPRLAFDHPLWILFSSGTTGRPKAMVHGAGGSLLEHVKEHRLHCDLDARDTLYFHTTAAWMMWNWQLSALAVGAHVVLDDGPVSAPEGLWDTVSDLGVTVFGTSSTYLQLCQDERVEPTAGRDLARLRAVLSTGSVLHDWQFDWVQDVLGDVPLQSISGGTDIVGCFVLGHPEAPVLRGRSQSLSLGLDVAAVDDRGAPVHGREGDLVCRNPFPSRPVVLLDDPDGARFHASYFADHPGLWSHGDRVAVHPDGSAAVLGRSDGVINVDGIRIGPSEIYAVVRTLPQVADALAVEQPDPGHPGGSRVVLLVVPRAGSEVDAALAADIRTALRREASPAHVPAVILGVAEIPLTHSGKKSEAAARAALSGRPADNESALRNPASLAAITAAAASATRRREHVRSGQAGDTGTSIAAVVARAFADVLGEDPSGPDIDFFSAGGTSRTSMTLLRRLRIELGRTVSMEQFLTAPNVRGLTATLLADRPAPPGAEVMRAGDPAVPPLVFIHGAYGDLDSYRMLVGFLDLPGAVLGLTADMGHDLAAGSVRDLAAQHAAELMQDPPDRPVRLIGYSFGGLVAYEVAAILQAEGRTVQFLGLLDPSPPAAGLTTWERRLHALGKWVALLLPGFADTTLRRVLRARFRGTHPTPESAALNRASRLAHEHRLSRSTVPVTYFRARRRVPVVSNMMFAWRRAAPDITVIDVPGAHHDLLRGSSAPALAQALTSALPNGC